MPKECEAEEMVLIPESKNAVPALVDESVPRPRLLATLDGDGRVTRFGSDRARVRARLVGLDCSA